VSASAETRGSGAHPSPEAQRVRDALEMHELGVELFRQRIRRERPGVDEAEVGSLTRAWLISAPRPDQLRAALGDWAW